MLYYYTRNLKSKGSQAKKDYTNLWHKDENNIEIIFRSAIEYNIINNTVSESNTLYKGIFPNHDEIDLLLPHPKFSFNGTDIRNGTATLSSDLYDLKGNYGKYTIMGKFRKEDGKKFITSLPLLRTAELYFIKAESQCKTGNLTQAKATLDEFMFNRYTNHKPLESFTREKLLEKILFEKQKEFLGEGISYFDMKRNKKEVEIYNGRNLKISSRISTNDFRRVLPIPKQEILQSGGKVNQNKGWN